MVEIRDSSLTKSSILSLHSFMDDIEEERMPERVKLSIASAGFTKLDTGKEEMDHTLEKERHFDILQQILPNANLKMKPKPAKEFKAFTRYDPTALTASQHETKLPTKQEVSNSQSKKGNKDKAQKSGKSHNEELTLGIKKGVDKNKAKIERADKIIQKSIDIFAANSKKPKSETAMKNPVQKAVKIKKHIVKEIKTQKWNEISSQKKELKEFKLFG